MNWADELAPNRDSSQACSYTFLPIAATHTVTHYLVYQISNTCKFPIHWQFEFKSDSKIMGVSPSAETGIAVNPLYRTLRVMGDNNHQNSV